MALQAPDLIIALPRAAQTHDDLKKAVTALDAWIASRLPDLDRPDPAPALTPLLDLVSGFNEQLTQSIIQMMIGELAEGTGTAPPLPFCWIAMGSDARGEQVIRTDQDNALIYADPQPGGEDEAVQYFSALSQKVTQMLDTLGFDLCSGNVMASNPQWCRSLSSWLAALDDWVGSSDPMAVRHLTILLDFKAVFGDRRLAAMLQAKVFQAFERHPAASHFLVRDDQLFAPPKKSFNRIRTRKEKGCRRCFNLKTQAIAHIVNGARLFAVNHHIQTPATLQRLALLRAEEVISQDEFTGISRAFAYLTALKIRAGMTEDRHPELPSNHIDVDRLDKSDRQALHQALDQVEAFQKKMADTYNQAWMNFFN